ncbi:carboxymuconolactone decarboxylase family protein [Streptomyces specialis]|uniref:carboxymuconolactone decarboxylase family protein n=1 Tax=Streptomyces specialis TaxID=498367 RepID=UPI00073F8F54|nr:carboxymuconolactone decarboxylase family protein [Streptomyces specialis]
MSAESRLARGRRTLAELGGDGEAVFAALADIAPDMGRYVGEFVFGDLYGRPGLTVRERQLLTLASLTALGGTERQVAFHLGLALNAGATPNDVVETLLAGLPFAGFPRTVNSLIAAREVFAARGLLPVPAAPDPD